jgi:hypothetical protein
MANFGAIRDALQSRLQSINGLRVYDTWPNQIAELPCAIIQPSGSEYEQTFGNSPSAVVHRFAVQLYVSAAAGLVQGQDSLDPYLSTSSTGGIPGAINADRTLGGVVWGTFVRGYHDYGPYGGDEMTPPAFMGVIIDVELTTS